LTDPIRNRGLDLLPAAAWETVNQDALAGRTLFITGATGFVGRWTLAAIARLNERMSKPLAVRALTRGDMPVEAPWLSWVVGDVRKVTDTVTIDFVLHAALSSSATPPGGDELLLETAIEGAKSAVRHASWRGAKRILVLSSGSAYGMAFGPLSEESPLAELGEEDTYGKAKREVERICREAGSSGTLDVTIARLFTCIGHGYRKHNHLAHVSMLDDARAGKPIVLRSDGSAIRSYIFGADLAIWLLAILSAKGSDVVNVGSDEQISMLDFAKTIARVAGRGDDAVMVKGTDPVVRPVFVPDISRARSLYGVAPWTNVESAIADALKDR
jgi:nucleoside-diphosphate-sugar epimerase